MYKPSEALSQHRSGEEQGLVSVKFPTGWTNYLNGGLRPFIIITRLHLYPQQSMFCWNTALSSSSNKWLSNWSSWRFLSPDQNNWPAVGWVSGDEDIPAPGEQEHPRLPELKTYSGRATVLFNSMTCCQQIHSLFCHLQKRQLKNLTTPIIGMTKLPGKNLADFYFNVNKDVVCQHVLTRQTLSETRQVVAEEGGAI